MSRIFKALERAETGRHIPAEHQTGHQETTPAPVIGLTSVLEPPPPRVEVPQPRSEHERLKIMLRLASGQNEPKSVMLVSAVPGEGVTSVALGLAAEMAPGSHQGILLVESNAGWPVLAEQLQASPRYGLSDMLAKEIQRSQAIVPTAVPKLSFLSRGRAVADFSQPRWIGLFEELIADLRSGFDYVILDGGSLEMSPESLLLARRVEGVVLVVEAERTPVNVVREMTRNLRKAGANVLGVVLNRRHQYVPNFIAKRL